MSDPLDEQLLAVLACPCPQHAPLGTVTGQAEETLALRCQHCSTQFPVRDGIPVLLLDEAVPGPRGVGVGP